MKTFVVPDIHGRFETLRSLLTAAGVLEDGERVVTEYDEYQVVSIGDLANGTLMDMTGDEACLNKARDWFDYLILGNHESGYLFSNMGFNGYHPAPHLRSLYNKLYSEGLVRPAVLVGNTLLSHAGVVNYFNFKTAGEAYDAIVDVWNNYREYNTAWTEDGENEHKFFFSLDGSPVEIPKALLLDAVSGARGGSAPFGGLLWSDWDERKNDNFSQVVGHSPRKNGPIMTEYHGTGVFTLNIDCGAKGGLTPWGVWLDSDGSVLEYVTVHDPIALTA